VADAFVHIEGIQKSIKKQPIIQQFSLRGQKGEVIALCGGNGAGKSTILRMIAGINQPDKGEIAVGGIRWRDNRKLYAEQIGYMPDDYRFSPGLTALETLRFWAKLRGLDHARAAEALAEVGLEGAAGRPVSSFSKGMKQRVVFAQALLAHPPLIIMDEPTNGLDPYWMESFIALVRRAAASGQTVIFSTHQLEIAEALADRVVFVQGGAAAFDGSVEQLKQEHGPDALQHAFAGLFGIKRDKGIRE